MAFIIISMLFLFSGIWSQILTILASFIFLLVLVLWCVLLWIQQWYAAPLHSLKTYHTATNAVWMKHAWVDSVYEDAYYQTVAQLLQNNNVSDVFIHVGPLDADGAIPKERYKHAAYTLKKLHDYYPQLRIQAWIGQVEKMWGGPLDITSPAVVDSIVDTAEAMMSIGFDGIHYNIEPILTNNRTWISLLQKTHERTMKARKILSISADDIEPFPFAQHILSLYSKNLSFWSREYFAEVAMYTDQIAMMSYDTTLSKDYLYAFYVYIQSMNLVQLVPKETTIFMGVPTYEDKRSNFFPEAENIYTALYGVRRALETLAAEKQLPREMGIALYAEWTTSKEEWQIFQEKWVGAKEEKSNK